MLWMKMTWILMQGDFDDDFDDDYDDDTTTMVTALMTTMMTSKMTRMLSTCMSCLSSMITAAWLQSTTWEQILFQSTGLNQKSTLVQPVFKKSMPAATKEFSLSSPSSSCHTNKPLQETNQHKKAQTQQTKTQKTVKQTNRTNKHNKQKLLVTSASGSCHPLDRMTGRQPAW